MTRDAVVLTAADRSDHSSTDHVNEQPMSYWIGKMRRRGYRYDQELSDGWRERGSSPGGPFERCDVIEELGLRRPCARGGRCPPATGGTTEMKTSRWHGE
jgi:hypothetical protein